MTLTDELRDVAPEVSTENFVHLHVHTEFSFLDGYNRCKKAAARAKELGMTHLAITDHNHLGGVITFQKECKDAGIKPILGLEAYWTFDTNVLSLPKEDRDNWAIEQARAAGFDIDGEIYRIEHPVSAKTGKALKPKKITKTELNELIAPYEYDTKQYHIILLAINQTGWNNLVRLQSEAAEKCTFNGRFLCDDAMLAKYNEGLIMTTACIGNVIPTLINRGEYEKARQQLETWQSIFGDRFFLEIQPLDIDLQRMSNLMLTDWAYQNDINLIATTDAHYTLESDWDDHDTLLCIGIGKLKEDEERMKYSNDFWLKSYDEMISTFDSQADSMVAEFGDLFDKDRYMSQVVQALANTNHIASVIEDIKLGSDINLFPHLEIPYGLTAEKYLEMECFRSLFKYKIKHPEIDMRVYQRRITDELKVINNKGFAPYVLVVKDYIEWANANGCPTGPGRGSGAGSLVLFLMGITKIIDPIKYNLLFFRFLTADRTSPPDVDTDFEYYNRDRVIEYLEEKYGKECVAHIGTYTSEGVKSGLKDVGRVLNIPFTEMNEISKKVDIWSDKPDLKFKDLDAYKDSDRESERMAWKEFNEYEGRYPELFRLARAYEGIPRNYGVHASGILITPMAVTELFPTRYADGTAVTLYTGPQLEDLKAIKFDILGLKTLSVIKETLHAIDENLTFDDLYEIVDVNDPKIYEMMQKKQTEGLFQVESNLFKGMFEEIIPTTENDVIVTNALGRPGPISAGMPKSYALRKNGHEEATEPLPGTWEVVKDTYGTIAYQEQIMIIAKIVAGFDDNQSDSYLRKAFAKKKKDKMIQCRQWFIYGKINAEAPEGYDEKNADQPAYDPKGKHGPAIPGGIANGYTEAELVAFWTNIEGFADYLFNKSHAACYAYICILTAWLKTYYPAKFMAALLSVQNSQENLEMYIKTSKQMGIEVRTPDINLSGENFVAIDNTILFGLGSIKGVGGSSIPAIMEARPYMHLSDAMAKIGKKFMNKRVGLALIKAGAFDFHESNRHTLINSFYDIRQDDVEENPRLNPDGYDEEQCMAFEREVLSTTVTYTPWWEEVKSGDKVTVSLKITNLREKPDKNGNMMAWVTGVDNGCQITAVIFSRQYCNNADRFDRKYYDTVVLEGKKDDKGSLVVSKVVTDEVAVKAASRPRSALVNDIDARLQAII